VKKIKILFGVSIVFFLISIALLFLDYSEAQVKMVRKKLKTEN